LAIAQVNAPVILIGTDGKRFLLGLRPGQQFHTHRGIIEHDALIGQPLGRQIHTHLGHPFVVLQPSLYDLLMDVKRASQIIYPKDIGMILLKLNVGPGQCIVEAGTGSGALTLALAHASQPDGVVYSYDSRDDMLRVAEGNLDRVGLLDRVRLTQRDISEGFTVQGADSLFLDVREPWDYLPQVCEALADGGFFGALVPTTNQVVDLLEGLSKHPFSSVEVMEILVRYYKPVPGRLRPQDMMNAHTGYLIFGRKIAPLLTGEGLRKRGRGRRAALELAARQSQADDAEAEGEDLAPDEGGIDGSACPGDDASGNL
jgi:tRNA (adenine57-N1/adenine58-N1)-methyltransferase